MFTIDKMSRTPIYEQLIDQFESNILSGRLELNCQLPSVRYLSQTLSINPNTLQRAYIEIERRGLCYSVPGNGRYLSPDALEKLREASRIKTSELKTQLYDLRSRGIGKTAILELIEEVYGSEERKDDPE